MKRFPLFFALAALAAADASAAFRANTAASRIDGWWAARHAEKVAAVADSSVKKDVVFIGDELTQDWETTGAAALATHFAGDRTMFNLGFAGDCTENVLWRIQNGELGSPKVVFLMIGGNNAAIYTKAEEPAAHTIVGIRDIIDYLTANCGSAKIVVQAILPRGLDESDPVRPRNDLVNNEIRRYAQEKGCSWVDMTDLFLESDHHTLKSSLYESDKATLNAAGYEVWAQAVADHVAAAVNGSAMPSDVIATTRPANAVQAAYPSSVAQVESEFWKAYLYHISAIGGRNYDIVLLGDSITQKWSESANEDSMNGLGEKVFNLGRTGDYTENLLWRLEGGCLDGYTTKFFNLLIGTNNTIGKNPSEDPEDIAEGVRTILDLVLAKHPESKVLLMPILPYGYTNAANNAKGTAQYANNEAANAIICSFADDRRVFLVDVRRQFLNDDGTFKGEMYLGWNGSSGDFPDQFLHLSTKAYQEIMAPAISAAMAAAGASPAVVPTLGSVAAQVSGTSATISLSDVAKGVGTNGVAPASYSVVCKLDTAAEATVLSGQTGATASFALADLADGWHSCAVMVETGDGMVSAPKRVAFLADSHANDPGWKLQPMDETGSPFRSDGTQVFARSYSSKTAGGVSFSSGFPNASQATVSPSTYSGEGWGATDPVFGGGWSWAKSGDPQDLVFTLKGLTAGRRYLVQILAANHWNDSATTISAGDLAPIVATKTNDYKYGAVLSRVFDASGAEETVTVTFSGTNNKCLVKAIQLRDLGEGGGAAVVAPSVGSVTATPNGTAVSLFLSGIVMGTDDAGTNATSYSVSYSLTNAAAVTALQNQTAATASFVLSNLADGEYTCSVTITTDKNKTSAAKTVSFRIGTPPPEVVAPSIGSASATTSGGTATISLSGVAMGTDDEGVAATSYSVSYSLTNAPAETVLSDQTGATASFQIADLADGSYTCEVTVTTDKNKTASKSVSFAISTSGGGGSGGSYEDGWTAAPLGATSASIRTDGTLLYAYARENYTVNGVAFASEGTDGIDNGNCTVPVTHDASNTPPTDTESGDYKNLLGKGWYASAADRTVTLRNLEAGKQYLVQLVASRSDFTTQTATAPDGEQTIHFGGTGWEYGGSLIGVFTAEGTTQQFTIRYAGNSWLNAIQVRELPEGGGGGGETPVCTLTIPAKTGLELVSVTTNGVAVAAAAGNAYSIVSNDTATITFAAASGYEIVSGNPVVLAVTGDKTLADAEYPVVRQTGGGGGETPVCTLTIPAKTGLELVSVTTNGVAVAAAAGNAYSIVSNDTVTITFAAASGYEIMSGNPVVLAITGDKTLADAEYPVVRQTGGGGDFDLGWTVSPMSADFASICTNGEPVYAYATHNYSVNGVAIEKIDSLAAFAGAKVSFSPIADGITSDMMNEEVADYSYGILLGNAWYWNGETANTTVSATLTGLVPGNVYLVQLVSHNHWTSHMAVSAGGAEPLPIGSYDTDNGCRYGASVVGVFEATATTQTFDVVFSGSTGKCPINFIQVRQLAGGGVLVVEPSIGSVSAAMSGSTAIIALGGVVTGTDDEGVAATSYTVSYSLDGWTTETEKLWNQTGSSVWFNITNLADGDYVCSVEIVTDKGCTASNSVAFTIDSTAPASTAWILTEMDPAGACVRTDGELLYAHAPHQLTANGVPFEWTPRIADANFSASPVEADASWGWMMNEGVPGLDGYGYLLGHAWFWDTTATDVEMEITLKGLTPGKNYLVQLFSHNRSVPDMRFSVEGSDGHPIGTLTDVEIQGVYIPYRYGTTAVGFFTASDSTQSFKVAWADSTGSHPLNALQVRDLGLAVPVVVEPSIGDASAAVDGTTAVVTLSGVVKGTGDDCEPASSYSVTHALDGGDSITVLEGRTGATAAFALAGLADGDHVCVVSIATDKGKTSEAKTVHITIGSQPFEWKTEPMDPSGETISTNGVRVWAYCRGADGGQVIANGVSFTSYEDLDADRLNDKMITLPFSVSSAMLLSADDWGDEGVDGGLGKILSNAFYAGSDGSRTFTLGELEKGHTYLVQLIMHKSGSGTKAQSPFNVADHVQFGQTGADDTWKLGGSLIGTFLAESDTHTFTVKYDGDFSALNAIQLRDLGVTVATESDPSVEAVSAKRKGTTATVTLSGVAMGTDANRHPATSYAVSYRLDGGAWTTALPAENGETASFELSGLDYRNYVCEVMIETDVGKQTAPQSVTLAFAKSDGLTIVCFDAENAALAFDMGSEGSVRTLLPDASAIYCTVVTSTNLEDAVWTPAGPSLAWKANPLPLDDETGWTWVTGLDTADPVRFFRVALTPAALEEDDEVVFK